MSPYHRILTTSAPPERGEIPKRTDFPLQDYLDENLPVDGAPWWTQPGAPIFAGGQGSELFNEWVKNQKNPWKYGR